MHTENIENLYDLCTVARAVKGIKSDNKLAQHLGVQQAQISNTKRGKRDILSDDSVIQLSEMINFPPEKAVAMAHIQRAKTDREKQFWTKMLKTVTQTTGAFFLGTTLLTGAVTPTPAIAYNVADDMYIMLN